MTTSEIRTPAQAERFFDESFVGDIVALIAALAREARRFARVVSHYTKLARAAEPRG